MQFKANDRISKKSVSGSAHGFTLLETVIAMVIMAGSILLLANSWSGAYMRVRKTQTNFEIATMLERKMNDVELEYRGKALDEIPESKDGDFGSDYPQYSWKLASKKLEFPDISGSLTARAGGADQMLMSVIKQLTDILGKSIKEVTVSVIYKPEGRKPTENSVTTYFLDYDKDISLGLPTGGG